MKLLSQLGPKFWGSVYLVLILKWFHRDISGGKWMVFEHWAQKGIVFDCAPILRGWTGHKNGSKISAIKLKTGYA